MFCQLTFTDLANSSSHVREAADQPLRPLKPPAGLGQNVPWASFAPLPSHDFVGSRAQQPFGHNYFGAPGSSHAVGPSYPTFFGPVGPEDGEPASPSGTPLVGPPAELRSPAETFDGEWQDPYLQHYGFDQPSDTDDGQEGNSCNGSCYHCFEDLGSESGGSSAASDCGTVSQDSSSSLDRWQ
ncbi:hypothetical protein WJX73_008086 [Symbiochloris irregularis]|uniref:Uncharacterized protein n=1 Tax=Symbiochloris irregularis TaxID=706552 RepID=A0AAW1NL78_9CHLO